MKLIQNTNMAFRCPSDLKERLENYAEGKDLHVSSIIRSACSDWLKRKEIELLEAEEEARLAALVRELMKHDGGRAYGDVPK